MAVIRFFGACALFGTMILISISVLGRHLNTPLPGSVEIVEVLILIVASTGILFATTEKSHASAKIFIDRLGPKTKIVAEKFGILLGVCICLVICLSNIWFLFDVWQTHEASHLLGIPIVPFRLFFIFTSACTTIVLAWQFFTNNKNN